MQLAQHMGLNDTGLLMLEVAYGRMNAEQAQAELVRREQTQAPVEASPSARSSSSPLRHPRLGRAVGVSPPR